MSKHHDKRTESQFQYNSQDPFDGGEDPWYSWNPENHEEHMNQVEKEHDDKEDK